MTGLAGVNADDGRDGDHDVLAHSAKSGAKAQGLIAKAQSLGCMEADVEDDPAVLDVLRRHLHAHDTGIDHDMRRLAVVGNPFVHGTKQVGPA